MGSKRINETQLFTKYRSSYGKAIVDFSIYICILGSTFYSLWYFRNGWISIITIPAMSLVNIRSFIMFHDLGHTSYFPDKMMNYIIGSILGILIWTPYCWNYHHYNHHLTNGNINNKLNHRFNETIFHNLEQYKRAGFLKQIVYKMIRHPLIFYICIPMWYVIIKQRLSVFIYKITKKHHYRQSASQILFDTLFSNIGTILFIQYLVVHEIILHYVIVETIVYATMFAIFHNHHTFNPSYVVNNEGWNVKDSGIRGSSSFILPWFLIYVAGGGEHHHIHHINAKIPIYNMRAYHEEVVSKSSVFDNIVKLSMTDCYNNLWLVLYDEENDRYITFAEADPSISKIN
jgi:omega-6 fatty acid desaturase (delta-12 desaturase)